MRNLSASLLLSAALLPAYAQQPEAPETIEVAAADQYVGVLAGYFNPDRARGGTDRGVTASVLYGYRFDPHWGVEAHLTGSTIETGGNQGTDFYQQGGGLDAVYGLKDRSLSWTPFALAGFAIVHNDLIPDSQDGISLLANVGVGAVSAPLTSLEFKVRGEGRYQRDFFQGGYNDFRLIAGIEIPFGKRTVVLPPVAPPVVEVREVVKEVVVEVVKPFIDSDKDSIEDSRDKCADTPQGLKVDADGCVIEGQVMELRGVTFAFNSGQLQLNAQTVLDYVEKGMKGQPSMTVEIAGHTDSVGSKLYNLRLSQKRADSVRAYLIGKGIDATRLNAKGYGKYELLVNPEKTETDKERNRRVMFRVLTK